MGYSSILAGLGAGATLPRTTTAAEVLPGTTDASGTPLAGAAVAVSFEGRESPIKPFSSVRRYKPIVLPNGLEVLLVSDAKYARQSSAALTVWVAVAGAPHADGLAHLIEHVVLSSKPSLDGEDFGDWIWGFAGA